ncbi:uncharacterized protein LOC122881418 isoform X1 [Siniperca chuatsi]|uniref:uncharacterized protein LOC122881418 isoform X1 n=1 Tax=Siniperca chuatsi TaxID=119488 RepID=UPI001CE1D43A|nr:uncharacterized protein LOC122881418 isoform X1 [Siniperca chuatsi]
MADLSPYGEHPTAVNAMFRCGHQRVPAEFTVELLKHFCLLSCPAISNLKLQPSNLLNFWETELFYISTVQPWPPQKQCFQTKVTLIMFQLIWYPNSKDRGTPSNCIENIVYT